MRSERDIEILLGQHFIAGAIRLSANIPMPAMGCRAPTSRGARRTAPSSRPGVGSGDRALARYLLAIRTADIPLADESYPHAGHRASSLHAEISPRLDEPR